MFFKNLKLYQIQTTADLEQIIDLVNEHPARRCHPFEVATMGFRPPVSRGRMGHVTDGRLMLCIRQWKKDIPAAAINEAVNERIIEIEKNENRRVGRRERLQIKEAVITEMTPNAIQKPSDTHLYYDSHTDLLALDTTSDKLADDIISRLRQVIESSEVFRVKFALPHTVNPIEHTLTRWVKNGNADHPFTLGTDVSLETPGIEASGCTFKGADLSDSAITAHIDAGMVATKLALSMNDRVDFTIDGGMTLSKIRFSDIALADMQDDAIDGEADQLDADFALMGGEFTFLIDQLAQCFGGFEQVETEQQATPPQQETHSVSHDDDALYAHAVRFVAETQRASISAIQRHLRIGYNRSAVIMERMEQEGVVTKPQADGARAVLIMADAA